MGTNGGKFSCYVTHITQANPPRTPQGGNARPRDPVDPGASKLELLVPHLKAVQKLDMDSGFSYLWVFPISYCPASLQIPAGASAQKI
jgi:hypothetical protein